MRCLFCPIGFIHTTAIYSKIIDENGVSNNVTHNDKKE